MAKKAAKKAAKGSKKAAKKPAKKAGKKKAKKAAKKASKKGSTKKSGGRKPAVPPPRGEEEESKRRAPSAVAAPHRPQAAPVRPAKALAPVGGERRSVAARGSRVVAPAEKPAPKGSREVRGAAQAAPRTPSAQKAREDPKPVAGAKPAPIRSMAAIPAAPAEAPGTPSGLARPQPPEGEARIAQGGRMTPTPAAMRGRAGRFPQRGGEKPPVPQGPLRPGEVLVAPGKPQPEFIFEGPPPLSTPELPAETVRREAPRGKGERQDVREANQGFYDALEARDIALMQKVWANDGTVRCTEPNGVLLRGWEEVRRTFENLFSSDRPYRIELTQLYSEESDALAYVSLVERVEMPQTTRPRREHVATNVFRLEKGLWKLVLHHTT